VDAALAYSTNAGNLRLSMTDLFNEAAEAASAAAATSDSAAPDPAVASPVSQSLEGLTRFQ
jgi:hypothetical protein